MTTIQFGHDDDGVPISWPARWVICSSCRGDGTRVLHGMAFTSSDIDEAGGQDFIDDMRSGVYDTPCRDCNGDGKVLEIDEDHLTYEQTNLLEQLRQDEWEANACDRSEARAFGYDR